MAKHVVEDIRHLQVIQLLRPADELPGREAPVRQVLKKHLVGHQPRHRHHLPAGVLRQHVAQALEVGNLVGADGQGLHAGDEGVACPAGQQPALALKQGLPHRVVGGAVVLPALVDGPVGARRWGVVAHGASAGGAPVPCEKRAKAASAQWAKSMSRWVRPPASWVVSVMCTRL